MDEQSQTAAPEAASQAPSVEQTLGVLKAEGNPVDVSILEGYAEGTERQPDESETEIPEFVPDTREPEAEDAEEPEGGADPAEGEPEDDGAPLSFDPIPPAGGETATEEAPAVRGYAPPERPDWLDRVPEEIKAQAESLFNGMATLHRERAEVADYRKALRDPERAAETLYAEVRKAAENFGLTPEAFAPYLFPDIAPAPAEDAPYGDDEPEQGSEERIAAEARRLLESDPEYAAFKAEREQARLETHRKTFVSTVGKELAPKIAARLDGFPVTPEMVLEARESAYLRHDEEAFTDPVLAVETKFRKELREFRETRPEKPKREKAPPMLKGAGSSPAHPDFKATAADARRFLEANPDY